MLETADDGNVKRFLNRIIGMRVATQNLVFGTFSKMLRQVIEMAKRDGKYSEGVQVCVETCASICA